MMAAIIRFCFDQAKLYDIDSVLASYSDPRNPVVGRLVGLMPLRVVEMIEVDEFDLIVYGKNQFRIGKPQEQHTVAIKF